MPYTEKKKESNKRYMDKLSRVTVWCTPEEKQIMEDRAKAAGKSMNQYIKDCAIGT